MKALDSHRQGLYNSEMVKEKRDDESRRGGGGHYMEALKVAIADDNELMLDMLGELISSDKDLNIVGKAKKRRGDLSDNQRTETGCCTFRSDYAEDGWTYCYGICKSR